MKDTKTVINPIPYYLAALTILVLSLIFPIYKWGWFIMTAVITAGVLVFSKRKFPDTVVEIEKEPVYDTGLKELDEALKEAHTHLASLKQLERAINDERVSAAVTRMIKAGQVILYELSKKPDKAFKLRRFLNYYLPTSDKLLQSYKKQELLTNRGSNSEEIMREVEDNCETIAKAFEASLDSLYSDEALDISTDIDVLDGMVNKSSSEKQERK